MPTAQQELERLGGKYDLAPEDFMPAVESEPLPGGTAAQELARLGRKHGLLGEPDPSAITQERFEPEPAPPVSTAVAPGFTREEPAGISARPAPAMQRAGEWITEKAQTHRELLDEANKVVADFTSAIPKEDVRSLMIRGAAGFVTGLTGFMGADIPGAIGGVMAAEPGERVETAAETGEEFFQGVRELAGSALITADKLIRDHIESTPDPFDEGAYDYFVEKVGGPITEMILGREITKEEYNKVIDQVIEHPEEPVFGALIMTGALKMGAKVTGKIGRRVGTGIKKKLTRKREIKKEAPAKEVEPATEGVMRAELTERTEAAKELGAMLFSEKTIADMTRGELEYYTGRTRKPPTKKVPSAKEVTQDRRGRDEIVPEGREEGRVGGAEPVEGRGEPVGRGERPVEEGKAEKVAAKYKRAGEVVDGRKVRSEIPNQESISSTFEDYTILPGIREVPMSEFEGITGRHYSVEGNKRIADIAEQISKSKEINPLIVAIEEGGPYILEGATRIDALYRLGAKSFPAQVVIDKGSLRRAKLKPAKTPETVAEQLGIEFKGLQEAPKRGPDGKIIKPLEMEQQYQFTDPMMKSDLTVKNLSEAAADLKTMREAYAAAKKPKEIPLEKEAVPAPPEKVAKEAPKPELPKAEAEVIGLKKTEIDRIREHLDLDQLEKPKKKAFEKSMAEAKAAKLDQDALIIAKTITKEQRPVTAAEHAGMVSKAVDLFNEFNKTAKTANDLIEKGAISEAQFEIARKNAIRDQLDALLEASERYGGTETARALSIRRMMRKLEDNTPAGVVQRARISKGEKLTAEQALKAEKAALEYSKIETKFRELEVKYEQSEIENSKLRAKRITDREVRVVRATKRTVKAKELIFVERAEIKKQLAALGYRVNEATGVSAEGAYLIGKLAVNYIKEGAFTLDQLVTKVLADVPDISKNDVYQSLIARDPRRQKRARSDATKRIAQLRTQARLLVQIEKAEKNIFDVSKKRQPQPVEIKELQTTLRRLRTEAYRSGIDAVKLERALHTINSLQDQLVHHYRTVRKRQPIESAELTTAKEQIKDIRRAMHVEDELARVTEQLRTGEFEVRERPVVKELPPELERTRVELEMGRKRIRNVIDEMAPMTRQRVFAEAVGTLRVMKATADMSGTLRQGAILSVMAPEAVPKNFYKSLEATFSEFKAEQIDAGIRAVPHHYIRYKAGLFLGELGGKLVGREEMFMANAIEKVPVIGTIVKASNRHMVTYLNLMRTAVFDKFLETYPNATHAERAAWADAINVFSGRGNLGKAASIANELSLVAFAPRFAASRIQTPYMIFKHWKQPRVRKEIAKAYRNVAGVGASILMLADLAGYEVGLDPRSPDWGKIRIGTTRIDIWAGVQQPVRLVTRIMIAGTDRAKWTGKDLTDWQKHLDPIELIGRFAAFKLAPAITIPRELLTGKTAVGEPITPTETAIKAVIPLVYEDVWDAYKLEGKRRAAVVGGLTFFGVGASTYERFRSKKSARRGIVRLKNAGIREKSQDKIDDARRMYEEWNRLHPDEELIMYIPKRVE